MRRLLIFLTTLFFVFPARAENPLEDFSFIQITDMHVSPHLARTGDPGPVRGARSIAWICRAAAGPQTVPEWGFIAPAPAFALATGDLTEYGVIDDTWTVFTHAFKSLPYPLYVLPGNHDNTWVAMYQIMRQRHGGENYSFDQGGCHFACICSASPQEPVPTIDAKTRTWLRRDLKRVPPDVPIFVALHHPPNSGEFAPAEYATLIDLLRDYNVVLLLYGHGHNVHQRDFDGLDGVMGGSTFGKNAGYGLISVHDGVLRVAYHYFKKPGKKADGGPGWRKVLEKAIPARAPPRLFEIKSAKSNGNELTVMLATPAGAGQLSASMQVDAKDVRCVPCGDGGSAWRVDLANLTPGRHLLTVRAATPAATRDVRAAMFEHPGGAARTLWRREFPAGIKAGPVVVGDRVVVAGTDGAVTALDRQSGRNMWTFSAGAEVLGTPAAADGLLVFGSGAGKVYALGEGGRQVWSYDAGLPVYGRPIVANDTVYVGDNGGRLHALRLADGTPAWTFERADFAIESWPCIWKDRVVFGAWDGYLYALAADSGKQVFKVAGPKSSEGKAARYYAPADCGPVALADTLFVCDRGYVLGRYMPGGEQGARVDEKITAIAADRSGHSFYGRGIDDRMCRYGTNGTKVWETKVAAGRFPVPPTCHGEAIYVCSNTGLLSVLGAEDGGIRWQYQVTPGFYVMAPVAVDEAGTCYVAGMDGSVTAVTTQAR